VTPDHDAGVVLADHVLGFPTGGLPPPTTTRATLLVLDTLGAAIAAVDADGVTQLREVVRRAGGTPEAGVIASGERTTAAQAALVNATMARALEIDDVHEPGLTHATATMVPVALSVASRYPELTGIELLTAIALGIDAGCRLSMAPTTMLGGSDYTPRSMSRTYQTGVLAGSLVASRVAGAGREVMLDALGNAYSQCFGNLQGLAEGTLTVRVGQGVAAQLAVQSFDFAAAGIDGARQPLEGKYGWFQAFWGGHYDTDPLLTGLGERFEVDAVSIKPYACCKYAHTAIAAAVEIRESAAFELSDIERVRVHVYSADCWDLLCEPLTTKADPAALAGAGGWALAQFSFPYTIACALARGGLTTADLTDAARADPRVVELLGKVEMVMVDTTRGLAELPEPGHVEVELRGGEVLEATVRRAVGHPERPMGVDDQIEKFRWCAAALSPRRVSEIAEAVLCLPTLARASELNALLDPPV
jgi:2-methylcitrate dehydratase PrpD